MPLTPPPLAKPVPAALLEDFSVLEVLYEAEAPVIFTATATDLGDPQPVVTFQPASGALFLPGTTPVLCTATDASGNSTDCVFTVTVVVLPCCPPPENQVEITPTANGFLLQFSGLSGQSCNVQRSTDLISGWTTIQTMPVPASGVLQFEDKNPPPGKAFYRVQVQ